MLNRELNDGSQICVNVTYNGPPVAPPVTTGCSTFPSVYHPHQSRNCELDQGSQSCEYSPNNCDYQKEFDPCISQHNSYPSCHYNNYPNPPTNPNCLDNYAQCPSSHFTCSHSYDDSDHGLDCHIPLDTTSTHHELINCGGYFPCGEVAPCGELVHSTAPGVSPQNGSAHCVDYPHAHQHLHFHMDLKGIPAGQKAECHHLEREIESVKDKATVREIYDEIATECQHFLKRSECEKCTTKSTENRETSSGTSAHLITSPPLSEEKRMRNKEAAAKYRTKVKTRFQILQEEEKALTSVNNKLRAEVTSLESEVHDLRAGLLENAERWRKIVDAHIMKEEIQ